MKAEACQPIEADVARVLLHANDIETRVRKMAAEIAEVYNGDKTGLTLVPVLSGAIIFLADLIRHLPLKMKIGLVQISTYVGTSPKDPRTTLELSGDIKDRHVLIVDDILDTGRTLRRVQQMIRDRGPRSLRTAVLLRKPSRAPADVCADFVGFDIEDLFVIGYGLDYNDHYRNYPHVGVLHPELTP